MKKIAITQRLVENDSYYELRETLDINYCSLIREAGFLPIILPYKVDFEEYFKEFNIAGIILSGGNDLSICNNNKLSQIRDKYEKSLVGYCIKNNIPVFGICRGMQLIADYFGSSFKKVNGHVDIKHSLQINLKSKCSTYLNKIDKVNSYHSFVIDEISDNLNIIATSEDGTIEAIEHTKYKIFGQMWHSEREVPFCKEELKFISDFFNFNIHEVKNIVKEAGEVIMSIYNENIEVKLKEDSSPVTKADLLANKLIVERLSQISDYPIVTEEMPVEYERRKFWQRFWLIDPLDGTKDFLVKNGEFTVNIALIENDQPILGVVYLPDNRDIYYALKGYGAYKNDKKIYNNSRRDDLIGSDSHFHSTKMTEEFFNKCNIKKVRRFGSSIKLCKLAEGIIDIYPRLNGTKEWDTAAAHIIANEAGCKLIDVETQKELTYNKKNIKNNYFIASRNSLELTI